MTRNVDDLEVTVIVPVFDAMPHISEQLAALEGQDFAGKWELLLADNGSMDGSREYVEQWAATRPHVRVLDAVERAGAAHARNVGYRAAHAPLLLFTDADDVVATGWISAMRAAADRGDLLAGVDVSEREELNRPGLERPPRARPARSFLPFTRGGNVGITRTLLEEVGGWNEEWIRGQDVELVWRAQLAGHTLTSVSGARVFYRRPVALRGILAQQYEFGRRAPELYRAFAYAGAPQPSLVRALGELVRCLARLPYVTIGSRRRRWLVNLAGVWGRTVGTVRSRPMLARGIDVNARR